MERLEGGSLAALFYSVVGKMDEKLEVLKSSAGSVATEILQLEESILQTNNQKKEIEEAVSAGNQALEVARDVKINIDGFTKFADFFFDGLFVDWMVADQISKSQKQVALTISQIEESIERLEKLQRKTDQDREYFQKQLEEVVVRS